MIEKTYIGDGVYVAPNPDVGGVTLTVEDGYTVQQVIHLEGEVLRNLLQRMKAWEIEYKPFPNLDFGESVRQVPF